MLVWHTVVPTSRAIELLGMIPDFLVESDERPAKEQIDERYAHGGGWRSFEGFTLDVERPVGEWELSYPEDPPMRLVAFTKLREETIAVFQHAWVAIVAEDGSYDIARLD